MEILNDFNTSVRKAFDEIDYSWRHYLGLVVCGTHSPHDIEDMTEKIRVARLSGVPFLGICFGHQLAAIEYARNVLGIKDATSEEFGRGTFVVKRLPSLKVGLHDGETYWNNYEVEPSFIDQWEKPRNFITVQFHPEYQSSEDKPHPIIKEFLEYAKKYTNDFKVAT
jgi:CTP synthase (UTP-ammonia lyase)